MMVLSTMILRAFHSNYAVVYVERDELDIFFTISVKIKVLVTNYIWLYRANLDDRETKFNPYSGDVLC